MRRRSLLAGVAALGAVPVRAVEAAGAAAAVATRCRVGFLGFSDGANRWIVTRTAHAMPEAARDLQLVYGNFSATETDREAPGPNPIHVRAELEYPEGQVVPLRFQGGEQVTIEGGALAATDPSGPPMPRGARFFVRTTVTVDRAPFRWPQNTLTSLDAGDVCVFGSDPATIEAAFRTSDLRRRQWFGYAPFNILGQPERPGVAVAIIGDSVVAGASSGDRFGHRSFVERALNSQVAWCNLASGGDGLRRFLAKSTLQRALIGHSFTHAICALGIDEIRHGDEAETHRNFQDVWSILAGMGLKVFQTTITTHTNSTDHWTTVEGQTVANPSFLPGGIYHRVNAWLRTVPQPLAGVFDPAVLLETGLDSGIWIAPGNQAVTSDGPHLDELGIRIATPSVDVQRLK